MEEKQNSLIFQDFNKSVLKPTTREEISNIIKECYKKNIPIEVSCLKSKKKKWKKFSNRKDVRSFKLFWNN